MKTVADPITAILLSNMADFTKASDSPCYLRRKRGRPHNYGLGFTAVLFLVAVAALVFGCGMQP